jgi:hypothetical protein
MIMEARGAHVELEVVQTLHLLASFIYTFQCN